MIRACAVCLLLVPVIGTAQATPPLGANRGGRLNERARQDREIVYFLQQPETHAFDLYHDYTESRPGVDNYLNVVRGGSKASNPSALILDTGEKLKVETLAGSKITEASPNRIVVPGAMGVSPEIFSPSTKVDRKSVV